MWYIVGLGNPGEKYKNTRHNVGWRVLDLLAEQIANGEWGKSNHANTLYLHGELAGEPVELLKPQTYMNKSGDTVRYVTDKYQAVPREFVVVYDDIDLPLGDVKLSVGKGDGGHNGIKSIISALGGRGFVRLRIGIAPVSFWTGKTYRPTGDKLQRYVLGKFTTREQREVDSAVLQAIEALKSIVCHGPEYSMNKFNQ